MLRYMYILKISFIYSIRLRSDVILISVELSENRDLKMQINIKCLIFYNNSVIAKLNIGIFLT